jgi:hypothetical protein
MSRCQRGGSPTVVNLSFLDRSRESNPGRVKFQILQLLHVGLFCDFSDREYEGDMFLRNINELLWYHTASKSRNNSNATWCLLVNTQRWRCMAFMVWVWPNYSVVWEKAAQLYDPCCPWAGGWGGVLMVLVDTCLDSGGAVRSCSLKRRAVI